MITIEKKGEGMLGTIYTDDTEMKITTGQNNTIVIVTNGNVTIDGEGSSPLATGDLWVIAGQSNCGRSRVSEMTAEQQALYATELPNVKMMNQYVSKTVYSNLQAGVNTMLVNANNADEFGFETSFFKMLSEQNPDKRFFCVKHGYGSASLVAQWQPTYDPLELFFQAMCNRIERSGLNAQAEGITVRLRGFIWMQGENDATNQTWANAYFQNFLEHWAYFDWKMTQYIKEGSISPESLNYKKVICKLKRFNGDWEDEVNQAFIDYAAIPLNRAVLVETEDLPLKDSIHFSATGQIELGKRIFARMFE
jgi:hypothetical protein